MNQTFKFLNFEFGVSISTLATLHPAHPLALASRPPHLLVSALYTAVSLVEVHNVTIVVSQDLREDIVSSD